MSEESNQAFMEHLVELRERLIKAAYCILAGTVLAWNFSEQIFDILRRPIMPYLPQGGLVFTGPMDKFMAHIKISLMAGVLISSPLWLWQLWKFVAPGLYSKEKKYAGGFIFSGTFLFAVGVSFAYFIVFPTAFKFLMTFGGDVDKPLITIDHYLSFVATTSIAFGVAFELPLIMVILGMMGVVSQAFLKANRRYAILILAVVSAILTPPDLMSMLMMLVPMLLLYELSVFLVGLVERKAHEALQT